MKKTSTALMSVCSLAVMASVSSTYAAPIVDPLIFSNGVIPNTGLSSQLDTNYPFESQVADDFSLAAGNGLDYNVTGIAFTGLQFGDPPDLPNPLSFNFYFYADNGAGTAPFYTGDGTTSPVGDAIASILGISLNAPEAAPGPYSYSGSFSPIMLSANTSYWLAIQSVNFFPPQFGWQGDNSGGGNALAGFPLLGIPFWNAINPGTEMDFELYGTQKQPGSVPEPASGLLLLMGMLGLYFGRRLPATRINGPS